MRWQVPGSRIVLVSQRLLLRPIRIAVGVAADVLGRIDAALARVGVEVPASASDPAAESPAAEDPEDVDEKVSAVREARKAAMDRLDTGLAGRLRSVEQHLLHQRQTSSADVLLPARFDRSAGAARLEDIRRRLLANTSRPDGVEDDD